MRLLNSTESYGVVAVALHWAMAVLIFGMFGLRLYMGTLSYYDPLYRTLPAIHKSVGVMVLIALIARLAWRRFSRPPAPLRHHAPWELTLSRATHAALYLLILAVGASGYLISTANGRPLEIFGQAAIPAVITGERLEETAGIAHLSLAISLISLAALHAGAALKHHFIDRDRTLLRMLGR